jgi:hypothetical protein
LAKQGATKIDKQQPPKTLLPKRVNTDQTVVRSPPSTGAEATRNIPAQFCSIYDPRFATVKAAMMSDLDYPKCHSRCDPLLGTPKENCEMVCYLTTARNAFARTGKAHCANFYTRKLEEAARQPPVLNSPQPR